MRKQIVISSLACLVGAGLFLTAAGATPQPATFTNTATFDATSCLLRSTAAWSNANGGPGVSVVWFTLHYRRADGTEYVPAEGALVIQPKPTHSGSLSTGVEPETGFDQTGTAYMDAAFYRDLKTAGAGGGVSGYLALVSSNTVAIDQTCF